MYKKKLNNFAFFDYNFNEIFEYFNKTSFICYPNLFVTELTTSDINHNYDIFSEKENFFYSKCFKNFNFHDYHFIYFKILDKKHIDKFISYKEYIKYLFKKKYNNNYDEFLNRIDTQIFSLNDIKYICHNNIFSS